MKIREYNEKLRPFVFFMQPAGLSLNNDQHEAQGDCIFCNKEDHFYISTNTGQWKCHSCQMSGNTPKFLQQLHAMCLTDTTVAQLTSLADDRSIPVEGLRDWEFAKFGDDWLLPAYNHKGKLANLYRVCKVGSRWKVFSTPTLLLHPFGIKSMTNTGPLWICEGPWDALALRYMLSQVRLAGNRYIRTSNAEASLLNSCDVISIPGCGSFRPQWLRYLQDRDVRLLFDNDHPKQLLNGKTQKAAWEGMQNVRKVIHEDGTYPSSLYFIKWGPDGYDPKKPSGYDVRDISRDLGAVKGVTYIDSILEKAELNPPKESYSPVSGTPSIEPKDCGSFQELCQVYEDSGLHFPGSMRDTLAIILATSVSTSQPGDHLWFRIIGPPGSGKSTFAMSLSACSEYILAPSILTGLHSGYKGTRHEQKKGDASLIPLMQDKMVIIKDADSIMASSHRDRILSEFRDLYDGEALAIYRNRETHAYSEQRTTFLFCGTDNLRALNQTHLGERFLDCEIFNSSSTKAYLDAAIDSTFDKLFGRSRVDPKERSARTYGYLIKLHEQLKNSGLPPIRISQDTKDYIRALGHSLSYIRSTADTDRQGELLYRPRPELATRLVTQFSKLSVCLAFVLQLDTIDEEVTRLMRKVYADTTKGFRFELLNHLWERQDGASVFSLHKRLGIPESTVRRHMLYCEEIGATQRKEKSNNSGRRGRNKHVWCLTPTMIELFDKVNE